MAQQISTGAWNRIRSKVAQWEANTGRKISPAIMQAWIDAELQAEAGKAVENRRLDIAQEESDRLKKATESDIEYRQRMADLAEEQEKRRASANKFVGAKELAVGGYNVYNLGKEEGWWGGASKTPANKAITSDSSATSISGRSDAYYPKQTQQSDLMSWQRGNRGESVNMSDQKAYQMNYSQKQPATQSNTSAYGSAVNTYGSRGGATGAPVSKVVTAKTGSATTGNVAGNVVGAYSGAQAGRQVRGWQSIESPYEYTGYPRNQPPEEYKVDADRAMLGRIGGAVYGFGSGGYGGAVSGAVEGGGGVPGYTTKGKDFDTVAFRSGSEWVSEDTMGEGFTKFMDVTEPIASSHWFQDEVLDDFFGFDSSGNGTVICTELNRQGIMPNYMLNLEYEFKRQKVSDEVYAGYRKMADPIVKVMKKSKWFTKLVALIAMPWAEQMCHEVDKSYKENKLGKFIMKIGFPLCRFVGSRKEQTCLTF